MKKGNIRILLGRLDTKNIMIILRQKTYTTAASFKPKFRKRFRNGDFSYVQAKNPAYEALNHQAYKEVAAEDEFKNNPETYKIRQGLFSEVSEEDKKAFERANRAMILTGVAAPLCAYYAPRTTRGLLLGALPAVAGVGIAAASIKKQKNIYKKYHPEEKWSLRKLHKFERDEINPGKSKK